MPHLSLPSPLNDEKRSSEEIYKAVYMISLVVHQTDCIVHTVLGFVPGNGNSSGGGNHVGQCWGHRGNICILVVSVTFI